MICHVLHFLLVPALSISCKNQKSFQYENLRLCRKNFCLQVRFHRSHYCRPYTIEDCCICIVAKVIRNIGYNKLRLRNVIRFCILKMVVIDFTFHFFFISPNKRSVRTAVLLRLSSLMIKAISSDFRSACTSPPHAAHTARPYRSVFTYRFPPCAVLFPIHISPFP